MTTWTSLTMPGSRPCAVPVYLSPTSRQRRGAGWAAVPDDGRAAGVVGVVAGDAGDQAEGSDTVPAELVTLRLKSSVAPHGSAGQRDLEGVALAAEAPAAMSG